MGALGGGLGMGGAGAGAMSRGGLGSRGGSGLGSRGGLGGGGGMAANPMMTGGSSGLFGSAINKNPLFTGKHGVQKS